MQDPFKPTTSSAEMASGYMPTPDQPARADSVPAGAAPAPDSGYKPLPFGGLQAMEDDDEEFQKTLGELTTGRVADVADLETAFEGIYGGDPVGLESFDLGFFKDGTPAIVLNGAPVPIEQSMWMALLNKRQQSRQEMDARMRFEVQKRKATDFVSKTVRAIPNLPSARADPRRVHATGSRRWNPERDEPPSLDVSRWRSLADAGPPEQDAPEQGWFHLQRPDEVSREDDGAAP